MSTYETQYLRLLRDLLAYGTPKNDRTGTGTLSTFGETIRVDLQDGFPMLTTKKLHWKSIAAELLWFLRGETNIESLNDDGVTIWDEWADENGDLGPIYGKQWRRWHNPKGPYDIDQIGRVSRLLSHFTDSRRMLVSAWNPADLHAMALEPCHFAFQLHTTPLSNYTRLTTYDHMVPNVLPKNPEDTTSLLDGLDIPKYALNIMVYQRSCDVFLGLPFNIASYALLCHLFAWTHNMRPGQLFWTGCDVHLYMNHQSQALEQLKREPRPLPTLRINPPVKRRCVWDFELDDLSLDGYNPHPPIKAPVAV